MRETGGRAHRTATLGAGSACVGPGHTSARTRRPSLRGQVASPTHSEPQVCTPRVSCSSSHHVTGYADWTSVGFGFGDAPPRAIKGQTPLPTRRSSPGVGLLFTPPLVSLLPLGILLGGLLRTLGAWADPGKVPPWLQTRLWDGQQLCFLVFICVIIVHMQDPAMTQDASPCSPDTRGSLCLSGPSLLPKTHLTVTCL